MLSGELVGRSALSGEIQKQVIAVGGSGGGDAPIKTISVDGVEVKPDSKKNVNIDLSGKVDKPPTNPIQQVVTIKSNGEVEGIGLSSASNDAIFGRIPRYQNPIYDDATISPQNMGNLVVADPTKPLHVANKRWVEDNFVEKFDGSQETGDNRFTIYGQSLGEQKNIPYSQQPKNFAIAQYSSGGNLKVAEPRSDTDATTKKYVDDNFVAKTTTSGSRVYTSVNGENKTLPFGVSAVATVIPIRNSDSANFEVGEPIRDGECSTKKYVDNKFNGASKPITYDTYSEMITTLNGMSATDLNRGQDIFIVQTGIPDVWVAYVEEANVPYTYVDDDTFVNELLTNGVVQVGYYKLGYLETQKVDLTEYAKLTQLDGKLDKQTPEFDGGATRGYVYYIDTEQNQTVKKVQIQANADTIPLRNPSGNFYVGDPTLPYECANVKTITALQGTEAPTESTKALFVGQIYIDTTNNATYQCTAIDTTNKVYTWVRLIRKTDYAVEGGSAGLVRTVGTTYGVRAGGDGLLFIDSASRPQILDKGTAFKPITPNTLDYAVKVGMTTNNETWSDEEKASARTLIDAVGSTDIASNRKVGLVKGAGEQYGISINENNGNISLANATDTEIATKTSSKAVKVSQIDKAVKVGLTTNTETLTDEEKTAVQSWLGIEIPEKDFFSLQGTSSKPINFLNDMEVGKGYIIGGEIKFTSTPYKVVNIGSNRCFAYKQNTSTVVMFNIRIDKSGYENSPRTITKLTINSTTGDVSSSTFYSLIPDADSEGQILVSSSAKVPTWKNADEVDLSNYYTKTEIDTMLGDISTLLDDINGEVV